jgi:hypothetical protein
MNKKPKEKGIKLCKGCDHFNKDNHGCRRRIFPVGIDLVYGQVVYSTTKETNAYRERASWFGCRKSGRYWKKTTKEVRQEKAD